MKPIIAIDGPAGSGKGTIAKKLAGYFNFAHLDTGILYRAIAYLNAELNEIKELSISEILKIAQGASLQVLKSEDISSKASKIAKSAEIREIMTRLQRDFIASPGDHYGGSVLDGRDIGTVVAPNAICKIFVTASLEVRAARRFRALERSNSLETYEEIMESLAARDKQDQLREISPLTLNDSYVVLDTSQETVKESFFRAVEIVKHSLEYVVP
ncbi:MAG: (d)CMP kinase [Holosporaceae bacterium]|jgi:cytidylate kinase|nr:(d)CMP kinase [Holosporaceae bacterium]